MTRILAISENYLDNWLLTTFTETENWTCEEDVQWATDNDLVSS